MKIPRAEQGGMVRPRTRRFARIALLLAIPAAAPGPGESPLPDPFSIEAAAAALDAVLARFAPDSTFLVAQGVGGIIALKDVQAHPGRVKGLVLVDVAVKSTLPVTDQEKPQFLSFIDQNYDAFLKMMFVRMGRDSAQGVALHAQAAQGPPAALK